jgi:FixJ family two-component response regulator
MNTDPTVFVVDDDPGILSSLRWLLESVRLAVETYDSAQRFLDACTPDRPGCLLLDLRMPGLGGLELQALLRERGYTLPVMFVTGHGDVPAAVQALKAGAFDFFEKPFNDHELLARIQVALAYDRDTRAGLELRTSVEERVRALTPRQRGILDLVVAGATSKDIARELGLSLSTVEGHRIKILKRMNAAGLADLVRMIASSGIGPSRAPRGKTEEPPSLPPQPALVARREA